MNQRYFFIVAFMCVRYLYWILDSVPLILTLCSDWCITKTDEIVGGSVGCCQVFLLSLNKKSIALSPNPENIYFARFSLTDEQRVLYSEIPFWFSRKFTSRTQSFQLAIPRGLATGLFIPDLAFYSLSPIRHFPCHILHSKYDQETEYGEGSYSYELVLSASEIQRYNNQRCQYAKYNYNRDTHTFQYLGIL